MGYPLGDQFPREGFVIAALDRHFVGCERFTAGDADLACTDREGVRWIIEAKGETGSTGTDFRTGLGQLIQGMGDREARYAMAMPDSAKMAFQRNRVSERVRSALGLYWMLVSERGEITVVPPEPAG